MDGAYSSVLLNHIFVSGTIAFYLWASYRTFYLGK